MTKGWNAWWTKVGLLTLSAFGGWLPSLLLAPFLAFFNRAAAVSAAYAALSDGNSGFLVERRGVHVDTAWAVGDLVRVIPVEVANANPAPPEDDNELQARVAFTVIGNVQKDVAVVA